MIDQCNLSFPLLPLSETFCISTSRMDTRGLSLQHSKSNHCPPHQHPLWLVGCVPAAAHSVQLTADASRKSEKECPSFATLHAHQSHGWSSCLQLSAYCRTGCHSHFRNRTNTWKISFSFCLFLPNFAFQITNLKKKIPTLVIKTGMASSWPEIIYNAKTNNKGAMTSLYVYDGPSIPKVYISTDNVPCFFLTLDIEHQALI